MNNDELKELIIKKVGVKKRIIFYFCEATFCFTVYMLIHFRILHSNISQNTESLIFFMCLTELFISLFFIRGAYQEVSKVRNWEIVVEEKTKREIFEDIKYNKNKVMSPFLFDFNSEKLLENGTEKGFAVFLEDPISSLLEYTAFLDYEEMSKLKK